MQDFYAVLAEAGPAFAEVRARRLTGASGIVTPVLREELPELLDTRFVRFELARLRGPHGSIPAVNGRRGA